MDEKMAYAFLWYCDNTPQTLLKGAQQFGRTPIVRQTVENARWLSATTLYLKLGLSQITKVASEINLAINNAHKP